MAGGAWRISNQAAAGSAASASQPAAASASVGGQQTRLRALQVTLAGTAAGVAQAVVRDGASGSGTIIWSGELSIPANGFASLSPTPMDLRASIGNALTVEFVAGTLTDIQAVNAQGDLVPIGYPYGQD